MAKRPAFNQSMQIVIMHGKEPFLMKMFTDDFATVLETEHGEIERIIFDGETTDLASVLDEVRTFDLLMRFKLVIVDNADAFLVDKGSGVKSTRKAMERYAESPVNNAALLLRATTWRPGKLDKAVEKVGLVYKLQSLNEPDAVRWCVARCEKEYDCTINPQGAQLLVQRIGLSLNRLDTELQKLSLKVAPNTIVSKDDVSEMVGLSKEEQAWEIQSVVLTGNEGVAMTKLSELLDISRQPKELLMWSVVDLTRRLSAASTMMANGSSDGEVRKTLKLFGDGGNRMVAVAKKKKPSQLAKLFTHAVAVDAKTKSGLLDGRRGLETLTLQICREVR